MFYRNKRRNRIEKFIVVKTDQANTDGYLLGSSGSQAEVT